MPTFPPHRPWLVAGASLAVSGAIVIAVSLPAGGTELWVGVGLVAAGSLALRRGFADAQQATETVGEPQAAMAVGQGIEKALRHPPPRPVALTRRGKLILAVWVLTLALFAALAQKHLGLLRAPASKARLDQNGSVATATVHSREARPLPDGRTLYFVGYSFAAGAGETMRVNRSVPGPVYGRLSEGVRTKVVYAPQNPQIHYLPDLTSPVSTRMVFLAGGLLLVAAGFTEAQRRRHRHLVARGSPARGFVANVRRRGGVRSFLVNYDGGGQRRTLKASERNAELRNGQTATVLYDPKAPGRAVLYRLALYRARA